MKCGAKRNFLYTVLPTVKIMIMDKRRRIPIKDVKQIALEITQRVLTLSKINSIELKLGKSKKPTDIIVQEEIMDKWIEDRIQMVIDRIDNGG